MVLARAAAVFLFGLLGAVAARLCGDGSALANHEAACDQEGQVCGACQCNSLQRWVCESSATTTTEEEAADDHDDCASIDFHKGECKNGQEGKQCGDCTCLSQKWVCGRAPDVATQELQPLDSETAAERELQIIISDEECQAINESNQFEECTEEGKICGNCACVDYRSLGLSWLCARQGARVQQCLGVEDGKFCPWIERGETCGDCECMPNNNRWSCPTAASKSFCDDVDDGGFCRWADQGSMCGTCFCHENTWECPERLCDNIFPGKFCSWRNRGRTCFGCECVSNKWVCPETTPTRQELCANDIFNGVPCRLRDEGRMCGECVCSFKAWSCPAELCPMIDNSCSGEHTIELSGGDFNRLLQCVLPATVRGGSVEIALKRTFGGGGGGVDLELLGAVVGTTADFLSDTGAGTVTYRWTCNEDPALACDCADG